MKKLHTLAQGLLRPINPQVTVILGALTFLWGLWVVNPFWEVFTSAPLFSKMAAFAPEWAWGSWSTTCGLLLMYYVFKFDPKRLIWPLGFAAWHWCTVSTMMWFGDWHNTGGLTYGFVSLYAAFCYLNIKINWVNNPK